jgi:hypothetical protein
MRSILALVLLASAVLAPAPRSQCSPFGPPCASSGMQLVCSTRPLVGTTWRIGERDASACGHSSATPGTLFTVYGFCFGGGVPIDPPLSCPQCAGCFLNVLPSLGAVVWTWPPRTQDIPIPANTRLIGATFCMQDVCVEPSRGCACMSQAIQVVIE